MVKGYWIICISTYDYEGEEIPKGRMEYYQSTQPVMSDKWRRATQEEIDTRRQYKGNTFNLMNV